MKNLSQVSTPSEESTSNDVSSEDQEKQEEGNSADNGQKDEKKSQLQKAIDSINHASSEDILHHAKIIKQIKHNHEAEKNGLNISDFSNHENDDYESKKISVESEQDFKKDLHKVNNENGNMADFSSYNLSNDDNKLAMQRVKEQREFEEKKKMLAEAERVREANAQAKKDTERALMTDLEMNLEAKVSEFDK